MKIYVCYFLILVLSFFSCQKESDIPEEIKKEANTPEQPKENAALKWDYLIDQTPVDNGQIFIGANYIGIENGWAPSDWPYIYPGAVFPSDRFATTFDAEVTGDKHPIHLTFSRNPPYTVLAVLPKGTEYLKQLKKVIYSEKSKNILTPSRRPELIRMAQLGTLDDIKQIFPENELFGEGIKRVVEQTTKDKNKKTLIFGQILFKGFTVSMETPVHGIFATPPANTDLDKLVYIHSLTYGSNAYFVITTNLTYKDVLKKLGESSSDDLKDNFRESQIRLFTISTIGQEAIIETSFDALSNFMKNPFGNKGDYGYPIYCRGQYVKDNALFRAK